MLAILIKAKINEPNSTLKPLIILRCPNVTHSSIYKKKKEALQLLSLRKVLVLNLNLPISFDSMSYISLSTNLVAKCDIQVDAAKVADIFDLPKFGATFLPLEERNEYIRRVFTFSKNTFRVKRRGAGLNHLSS